MLSGVLLHMVQAAGPIQAAFQPLPHRHPLLGKVVDAPFPLAGFQHLHHPHRAPVGELAAPLWEKGGAVQHHPVSVYYRFAGQHRGLPPDQMAILLVKPFCLHISLYLQGQLA